MALLSSFTAVPRFAMAVLSISKQHRSRISELWDEYMSMSIEKPQRDELQALRQKYKV